MTREYEVRIGEGYVPVPDSPLSEPDVCLVAECGGPRDCEKHPFGVDTYGGPR